MLQKIRDHLTGWIAAAILGLLVVPFVFWGVDFQTAGATYAAKVNGEEIPILQAREALQSQLAFYQQYAPGGLTAEQEAEIRKRVLDSLVLQELLRQHSRSLGYRVSDEMLSQAIREIPAFQVDGRFDTDTYRRLLTLRGESPASFEQSFRLSLAIDQLQNALARSGFVTPDELRRRVELEREKREVAYLQFEAQALEAEIEVSEAEIEAHYEANQADYLSPEQVTLQYIALDTGMVAEDVELDEADLRELYETELAAGRFVEPEEREARHVLIAVANGEDEAEARARAENIAERARAGEEFAGLAREHSDDSATAPEGGALGWVQRDMMVAAFSDALFAMEPGELRGPVKTEFGFHVIKLENVRGGVPDPFETVRDELAEELRQRRAESRFVDRAEELATLAFESLDTLEPVAEQLGLPLETLESVSRQGGEGIAANPAVRAAAFSESVLERGENSDLIELDSSSVVVLRVADRHPARQMPLEEVREVIRVGLVTRAARERARDLGEQALAELRAGGELSAVAAALGAEFNEPREIQRDAADLPPELISAVFRAPKPGDEPVLRGLALAGGGYAVFSLSEVQPGTSTGAENESYRRQYGVERGSAELTAYVAQLKAGADVTLAMDQLQ